MRQFLKPPQRSPVKVFMIKDVPNNFDQWYQIEFKKEKKKDKKM